MKKIFVMFATVTAFTLASCGGKAEQKATDSPAETAPANPEVKVEDKATEIKIDSSAKKQEAPAEMKKEEAKPAAEMKKEEVKK